MGCKARALAARLPTQLTHSRRIARRLAVHQPKARRDGRCERNFFASERELRGAGAKAGQILAAACFLAATLFVLN